MGVTLNYKIYNFSFHLTTLLLRQQRIMKNTCQTHCAIDKSCWADILANQIGSDGQRLHQDGRRPNAIQDGQGINAGHIVTLENRGPNGGDNGDEGAKEIGPILIYDEGHVRRS